ncbi:MAG: hypothetical protein R3C25_13655, partial [Hyphomonadaceae bacterium]
SLVAFAAAGVSAATWAAQPARVVATAPTIAPAQPLGIQAVRPVTTLAPTIDAVLAPVTTQPVALDGDDEVLEGGSGAAQRYQLSPEEREQIRAAIAEGSAARAEAIARAQAEIAAAMAEVDDSDLEGGLAAQTHALLADTMRLVQSDQLTAADHAEIRAALAARREDIRAAAEAARSAQIEAARDAAREANRADREAEREAAFAAREAAREAALEARDAARETRDAAREAAQDARDSAREAAREAREACVENRDACERDD